MADYECRICLSHDRKDCFPVREMMYGMRVAFAYDECGGCGSLQIEAIPDDLARYYPSDYYSMEAQEPEASMLDKLRALVGRQRDRAALGLPSLGGSLVPKQRLRSELVALRAVGAKPVDRIIDIGCGAHAHLLRRLSRLGFRKLEGADPFIEKEVQHGPVKVVKRFIQELDGPYDLVMLNHSYEHLPEPRSALTSIAVLLRPGGHCVLRLPTPSSEAFSRYRQNWVQIDAPRHLTLPSRAGLVALGEEVGLVHLDTLDDSTAFQFWGSEMYVRDIPLRSKRPEEVFSEEERQKFASDAARVNDAHHGDQVAYLFRKPA